MARRPADAPPRSLFLALAFLGSFLLFEIEVIATRLLLPSFGGAAYVWTTCMMFFQGVLLAGYAYSREALGRFAPAAYGRFHLALLLAPFFFLPIAIPGAVIGPHPALQVLASLARAIGAAFFVLSTTTPVIQSWLRASAGERAEGSYSVFAVSNAGALAALVSYPLLVEPWLTLSVQLRVWTALYAVYAALHWPCRPRGRYVRATAGNAADAGHAGGASTWFLLSLGTSASLLAATNLLLLDFAAVPLLWIAPLAVYLLTFVLAFARGSAPSRRAGLLALWAVPVWAALVLLTLFYSPPAFAGRWPAVHKLWAINKLLFILAALFILCLISHRALADSKPPAGRAARFYLWIGLGGWMGSALIGVLLPWAARRLAVPELDWAISGGVCIAALLLRDRGRGAPRRTPARLRPVAAALGAVAVLGALGLGFYVKRSLAFTGGQISSLRNFYGYYMVVEQGGLRKFYHGNALHGVEYVDARRQDVPLLSYHGRSPIADVFKSWGPSAHRIGVVGLGAGTLAAYGRSGQEMDFYELDPDVAAFAKERFHFLADSRARVRVVTGDARTSLTQDSGARYDLLILDAFTGGAVPVHLLTEEALRLYFSRLSPHGVIVFNVANRFLNLKPVLAAAARALGLAGAAKTVVADPLHEELTYSSWVALSRDPDRLKSLRDKGWKELTRDENGSRPWTDQYASLWSALGQ